MKMNSDEWTCWKTTCFGLPLHTERFFAQSYHMEYHRLFKVYMSV